MPLNRAWYFWAKETSEKGKVFPKLTGFWEKLKIPGRGGHSCRRGLISPLGWQLEEGYMRRYTAAWNCTQETAHRFAEELQGEVVD
jgi:hypothetical protein